MSLCAWLPWEKVFWFFFSKKNCFLVLVFVGFSASAADWPVAQSAACSAAISAAEKRYPLPPGLLASIARVESGRPISTANDVRPWPWAIDAEGRGLFLDSKPAAVAWVEQARTRGVFVVDVGCLQVNLFYHPTAFASVDEAFDPGANADYAARFLLSLYHGPAAGSWPVAVGLYHSGTPELAEDYRSRVAATGLGIMAGSAQPLYLRVLNRGALRFHLAGGGTLVLHVNRQPHLARYRGVDPCRAEALLAPLLARRPYDKVCNR